VTAMTASRRVATLAALALAACSGAQPPDPEADAAALREMVAELVAAVPNIDDGYCRSGYPAFEARQREMSALPVLADFNRVVRGHAIPPPAIDHENRERRPTEAACMAGLEATLAVIRKHEALIGRMARALPEKPARG